MFKKTSNPYKFKYLVTGITGPGIPEVYLPPIPPDKEILFKKEQKFVRPEMGEDLRRWAKEYHIARMDNASYVHEHQQEINAWEEQEDARCEYGIFFWNKGEITYINGFYYWLLTCWNPYFGKPVFRATDMEICYWIQFWEEDPDSYGGALNTVRRYGKSSLMGAWIVYRTTRNFNHNSGMQGETDKKIAAFYKKFVLRPFYKLPPHVQPTYNLGTQQASKIEFDLPAQRSKKRTQFDTEDMEVLESMIDYRPSGEGEYDGEILNSYVMEEPGKCLGKNIPVLMYDGSIKMSQAIKKNDILMGDDSTPRVVTELIRGTGKIYRIVSTSNRKAKSWTVTEDHILSCKISGRTRFPGYKKGDIVNIRVRNYLRLSENQKAHLNCYRVAVEYKEQQHKIDPYFLGVWLGDGSHSGAIFCGEDDEVIDYSYEFAKKHNYAVNIDHPKKSNPKFRVVSISGGLRKDLRNENLLKNKHIPESYMIDSRKNRLELLAGLIDTDGHREDRISRPNQRSYEIIQRRKNLAFQIQRLALSLGFYASCNAKTATMRRKDGTVYRNTVFRVMIYGQDMHEIPCKIERKKMPSNITTYNSKDPQVYGFRIQFDKIDKFYGFNVTGNKLFVLGDYTVTHNCEKVSLYDEEGEGRWDIIKPCFLQGGEDICGKAFLGTTVENLKVVDKGGRAYQRLFYDSDFNVRNEDGRTMSGLYAAFLPARYAMKKYMDEWGIPLSDQAWESLQKTRRSYAKRPSKLAGWIRKYPDTIREIFYVNPEKCEFNSTNIQEQLLVIDTSQTPLVDRVEFYWENNVRDSKVRWRHAPENGWCQIARGVNFKDIPNNQVVQRGQDQETGVKLWFPQVTNIIIGCDPIEHGVVSQPGRSSKPVIYARSKYDESLDGVLTQEILEQRAEAKYPYKSNRPLLLYDKRPSDPNKFFEYAIMICVYFGAEIHVESQKPAIISYFHQRGYGAFIKHKFKAEYERPDRTPIDGTPSSQPLIQRYTSLVAFQKEYFCHLMPFREILEDNLGFDPSNTKVHDYTVAEGFCELAAEMKPTSVPVAVKDITEYLHTYDRFGNIRD